MTASLGNIKQDGQYGIEQNNRQARSRANASGILVFGVKWVRDFPGLEGGGETGQRRASQVAPMVKSPPANTGDRRDAGSTPGSGRSPGGGHGNPPQCSCLENPMDRGAWRATVHGAAKSWTRLNDFTSLHFTWQPPSKNLCQIGRASCRERV